MTTTNHKLTSLIRELPALDVRPSIRGCYFLMRNDVVVYVGQSVDIEARIRSHNREREHGYRWAKDFDSVRYIELPIGNLNAVERALIHAFQPECNTNGKSPPNLKYPRNALSRHEDSLTSREENSDEIRAELRRGFRRRHGIKPTDSVFTDACERLAYQECLGAVPHKLHYEASMAVKERKQKQ